MAVIALEAGWVVTEVGRQPWIVNGYMTVGEAVTQNSAVWVSLAVIAVVYLALGIAVFAVLRSMSKRWKAGESDSLPSPYSPSVLSR